MTVSENKRHVVMEEEEASEQETAVELQSDETASDKESDNESEAGTGNAAWADSIAKILKTNKPKGKKALVLSKAKKLTDERKEKPKSAGFEVQTPDGEFKEEVIAAESVETPKEEQESKLKRKKKKELVSVRIKPNVLEKDRERTMMKIATKGVVQLFNAVKSQQKQITTKLQEAGPLEVRKDKVMKSIDKRAFLDVLMGETADTGVAEKKRRAVTEDKKESTWSVLRDDFMMGAKMKDWDKQLEVEDTDGDNVEAEIDLESD